MQSNRERVTEALDAVTTGLFPFVEQELKAVYKNGWHDAARGSFRQDRGQAILKGDVVRWDAHTLLTVMWDQWNRVFRHRLDQCERSLISELREFRNRWAHQENFNFDDTYRILDSVERLLNAVKAPDAKTVNRNKRDLMRVQFGMESRAAYKKSQVLKRKWQDFIIYLVCCGAIIFAILQYFGMHGWFLVLYVLAVFAYLGYQRTIVPLPVYFGPHECLSCGKIIYGESCPYCETSPAKPDAVEAATIEVTADMSS